MNNFDVEHLRLIEQFEIIVVHENNWHEHLTITKIEVFPDEKKLRRINIYVKPQLSLKE